MLLRKTGIPMLTERGPRSWPVVIIVGSQLGADPLRITKKNLVRKIRGLIHGDKITHLVEAQRSLPVFEKEKNLSLCPVVFAAYVAVSPT